MFSLLRAAFMKMGFLSDNTCLRLCCWGMCLWDLIPFSFRSSPRSNCLTCLPMWLMHNLSKALCTLNPSVLPSCTWLLIKGRHILLTETCALILPPLPHFLFTLKTFFFIFIFTHFLGRVCRPSFFLPFYISKDIVCQGYILAD